MSDFTDEETTKLLWLVVKELYDTEYILRINRNQLEALPTREQYEAQQRGWILPYNEWVADLKKRVAIAKRDIALLQSIQVKLGGTGKWSSTPIPSF